VQATYRTIITAVFSRAIVSEPHDGSSGDQMNMMNRQLASTKSGHGSFSFDIERGR
jgi:hypothetical protein